MTSRTHRTLLAVIAALAVAASPATAQSSCAPNWTSDEYKSFGDLQNEVKKQYGEVRILRVALCQQDGKAYFHVIIISDEGKVQRVQLTASAK
jgi:azurin